MPSLAGAQGVKMNNCSSFWYLFIISFYTLKIFLFPSRPGWNTDGDIDFTTKLENHFWYLIMLLPIGLGWLFLAR